VRDTLRKLIPGISSEPEKWGASGRISEQGPADAWKPGVSGAPGGRTQPRLDGIDLMYGPSDEAPFMRSSSSPIVRDAGAGASEKDAERTVPMVPVWQIQDRYIIAQTRQGLLIIDQHAAHERVLYERALRYLAGDHPTSQQLLFPVVVDLSQTQEEVLGSMGEGLGRLGIHIEEFGGRSVVLRSVPATWEGDPASLLRELLDDLSDRTKRHEERQQALAASFACHSAIRSGMKLDQESMNRLIDELFSTDLPHGDPHGRPTYIVLSVDELDRRFSRSG
jgi:DNA mismatch repair protein MutL